MVILRRIWGGDTCTHTLRRSHPSLWAAGLIWGLPWTSLRQLLLWGQRAQSLQPRHHHRVEAGCFPPVPCPFCTYFFLLLPCLDVFTRHQLPQDIMSLIPQCLQHSLLYGALCNSWQQPPLNVGCPSSPQGTGWACPYYHDDWLTISRSQDLLCTYYCLMVNWDKKLSPAQSIFYIRMEWQRAVFPLGLRLWGGVSLFSLPQRSRHYNLINI